MYKTLEELNVQVGDVVKSKHIIETNYEVEGIWQIDEAAEAMAFDGSRPGNYKYRDINNSGTRDEGDKKVLGSISPDWIGGMTNTFTSKNFDLSVNMYTRQGSYGHSEFYGHFAPHSGDDAKFNGFDLDYWTPNNQDANPNRIR